MTAPVIYFSGGEDFEFSSVGTVSVDTTSSHRRGAFCRCALKADDGSSFWDTGNRMSVTDAWFHARVWMTANSLASVTSGASAADQSPIKITDASGVVRLGLRLTGASVSNTNANNWQFGKFDASGAFTQLGSALSGIFTGSPAVPDELDIQVSNYATGGSGSVSIYINRTLVFTVSSATLATNSNTTINGLRLGGECVSTAASAQHVAFSYSEIIVSDSDTRGWTRNTLTPAADGNTDTFDTGGVSNINETTLDDATLNASGSAGQVQQYTIGSLPAGIYGVVAVGFSARGLAGSSGGPTKIDFGTRDGGADYWGSDLSLPGSIDLVQDNWTINPATSAAFTTGQLAAAGFDIGLKSVA